MLSDDERATPAVLAFLRKTQVGQPVTLSALGVTREVGAEGGGAEYTGRGEGKEEGRVPIRRRG